VVALQRFGSALNLNLHGHIVHLDGVFSRGADGRLRFLQAAPRTGDVEALVVEVAEACEAWLARRGFGAEDEVAGEEDDALAVVQQASLFGRAALGERAGRSTRVQRIAGREVSMPPQCAGAEGYTLHAGVSFRASEREGLERLCRCAGGVQARVVGRDDGARGLALGAGGTSGGPDSPGAGEPGALPGGRRGERGVAEGGHPPAGGV